jgi:S-(hydroxymethyl)glutathione dehydrogenase/alcohol dehydrogenase
MQFESAILKKKNKSLSIQKFNVPELLKGQVLVKIFYSGVCRSQLMEKSGKRGKDIWLPHALGHEASGKVIKIGAAVKKVKIGDDVILSWIKGKGINTSGFKIRSTNNEMVNFGPITTFSNYSIISENRVFKKPKDLSFKEAVLYGCAIPTGSGIVFNELKIKKKDKILLIGIGGIGLSCLLALKVIKAEKIYILEKNKKKIDKIKKLKINNIKIYDTKKDKDFDFCIDCSGVTKMIEFGLKKIKKNGMVLFASHPPSGEKIKVDPHELISGKKLQGTWGGLSDPDRDIFRFTKYFKKNKISLSPFFSKIYKLNEINKAFKDLSKGSITRAIISMEHN